MASQSGHCGNSPDTPADDASSEDGGTDWPTKSINMIVPMGAGGDTDFNARTYAKYLEDELAEVIIKGIAEGTELDVGYDKENDKLIITEKGNK